LRSASPGVAMWKLRPSCAVQRRVGQLRRGGDYPGAATMLGGWSQGEAAMSRVLSVPSRLGLRIPFRTGPSSARSRQAAAASHESSNSSLRSGSYRAACLVACARKLRVVAFPGGLPRAPPLTSSWIQHDLVAREGAGVR
jgi:hypothetical protein